MTPRPRLNHPLWTVAHIAEHLGVPRHRVEYAIDARGIRPADRAGIARVFDDRHLAQISSILARTDRGEVSDA